MMPRKAKTAEAPADEPQVNKSDAVRAALEAHPDKMPREIAELLRADGLDVRPQLVSTIKSNLKTSRGKKKTPRKSAAKKVSTGAKTGDAISLDALKKAKKLAAQLGGVNQAQKALAALSELLD
jgi:hypothetical protein